MKRVLMVGLALIGTVALASGSAGAADDPPAKEERATVGQDFIDANGDGVCDNCTGTSRAKGRGNGQGEGQRLQDGRGGRGQRAGSGNQVGPRDGSGNRKGPGGACDGSGRRGGGQGRRGGGRR